MNEKNFLVKGKIKIGFEWVNFKKLVSAVSEKMAIEKVFCLFGGNHKLKRFQIKISSVELVDKNE
ncbi:MAG: 50S ribosomal protein L18Ae [Candidatus Methanomethyliaceae archaeon]|nr:50S ribosomal protein L18Ae [Candidatus Methanomethyliaceae archaeon]MDW7970677.1 50S ribosomal protein L18Ae [Nitrososphaerota archaeon]